MSGASRPMQGVLPGGEFSPIGRIASKELAQKGVNQQRNQLLSPTPNSRSRSLSASREKAPRSVSASREKAASVAPRSVSASREKAASVAQRKEAIADNVRSTIFDTGPCIVRPSRVYQSSMNLPPPRKDDFNGTETQPKRARSRRRPPNAGTGKEERQEDVASEVQKVSGFGLGQPDHQEAPVLPSRVQRAGREPKVNSLKRVAKVEQGCCVGLQRLKTPGLGGITDDYDGIFSPDIDIEKQVSRETSQSAQTAPGALMNAAVGFGKRLMQRKSQTDSLQLPSCPQAARKPAKVADSSFGEGASPSRFTRARRRLLTYFT